MTGRVCAALRAWREFGEDSRHAARFPGADYRVGFVQADGIAHDFAYCGTDLRGALKIVDCMSRGADHNHHVHWFVYDADDPERGYFGDEYEWTAGRLASAWEALTTGNFGFAVAELLHKEK